MSGSEGARWRGLRLSPCRDGRDVGGAPVRILASIIDRGRGVSVPEGLQHEAGALLAPEGLFFFAPASPPALVSSTRVARLVEVMSRSLLLPEAEEK